MKKAEYFDIGLNVLTADRCQQVVSVAYLRKGHLIMSDFLYFVSSREIRCHFFEIRHFCKLISVENFALIIMW